MAFFKSICLFTDGGCKGNPGPGWILALLFVMKIIMSCMNSLNVLVIAPTTKLNIEPLSKDSTFVPNISAKKLLRIQDSKLVVNQMSGSYRLKNDDLRLLFQQVKDRERVYESVVYQHVNRDSNQRIKRADELLNLAYAGRPYNRCIVEP